MSAPVFGVTGQRSRSQQVEAYEAQRYCGNIWEFTRADKIGKMIDEFNENCIMYVCDTFSW